MACAQIERFRVVGEEGFLPSLWAFDPASVRGPGARRLFGLLPQNDRGMDYRGSRLARREAVDGSCSDQLVTTSVQASHQPGRRQGPTRGRHRRTNLAGAEWRHSITMAGACPASGRGLVRQVHHPVTRGACERTPFGPFVGRGQLRLVDESQRLGLLNHRPPLARAISRALARSTASDISCSPA